MEVRKEEEEKEVEGKGEGQKGRRRRMSEGKEGRLVSLSSFCLTCALVLFCFIYSAFES